MVEQSIRNRQVVGSTPTLGSRKFEEIERLAPIESGVFFCRVQDLIPDRLYLNLGAPWLVTAT